MGARRQHAPRHGSLRYLPLKRSRYTAGRIRNWLDEEGEPHLLGFAGFKAGMTHLSFIEDEEESAYKGIEIMRAVTIIETPPLVLFGIKVLEKSEYGLITSGELLAPNLNPILGRKIILPKEYNFEEKKKSFEKLLEGTDRLVIKGLFYTQPKNVGTPRKKPDTIEIKVSGGKSPKEQYAFLKEKLGQEIRVRNFVKEGEYVDTIAVTKGKGFQGPMKRRGVRHLQKKSRKTVRGVGCLGAWHPSRVMYTVARAGQMGYHNRVEINKRLMKIGEKGEEITPKGGFIRYGVIKSDYIILLGSVPGPKKRLVKLRKPMRPKLNPSTTTPEITYISNVSQQGSK
ncbi:MAG: 50S ribosomal protein L3e [Promethearchaeota archaeon CR_4]|nr:MAG: 50S ribosomal protein L3e [Candidatus Lokiarchaeota archaeon CR_4]